MTSISSVENLTPLKAGELVEISGVPLIISLTSYGSTGFRATYLTDGSFHDNFYLGYLGAKKIVKGSKVSLAVK